MAIPEVPLVANYDATLVSLSILIAVGASYTALDLTERVTTARGRARRAWLFGGALTMGVGIWSMHFTGMLAFKLPVAVPMTYDVLLTLLSVAVAVVASGLGLFLASRQTVKRSSLVAGGAIMGAAIVSMHYTGMAAMRGPCVLSYNPYWFAASVLVAIGAAIAALFLCFRLRTETIGQWSWRKLLSATVMGLGIAGMHYTGMAGAYFTAMCAPPGWAVPLVNISDLGASAIAFGTLLMLSVALISSHKERLQWQQDLMKDRFLGILSHELRTPINAITGFASVLEDGVAGPLNAQQQAYVRRILDGSERLLTLVDDLLDMSRMQAGKFSLNCEPMDVRPVVAAAVSTLASMAEQKGLRLDAELAPSLPVVYADGQRLGQVVINLVNNAIKFTPAGGAIRVKAFACDGALRIDVADTGPGIAPRDIGRLFEPFSQVDMSPTRQTGGVGLGLSICKGLVEAMGGHIGVESEPGAGTTFWLMLPALEDGAG